MDERTAQVVGEILEERQRLGDNIAELGQKIKEKASWRGYFARKPWTMLGIALGGGLLLSMLFLPKSH